MKKLQNELDKNDKAFLRLEWVISLTSCVSFFILIFLASYIEINTYIRIILITLGSFIFAIGMANAIRIEQVAGYYECKYCHHKYIPTYLSILFAMHIGRTRYLKCPKCGNKSWQKKVLK